jgi:hypothetical protein
MGTVPHFTFTQIPEAVDAIATHTWLSPQTFLSGHEVPMPELRAALVEVEALARRLREILQLTSTARY